MDIRKRSYSRFTLLDIFCMTVGFFSGIYLRHGTLGIVYDIRVYQDVYIALVLTIIATAFFFRPYEDIFIRGYWIEFVNVMKCLCVQGIMAIGYMFITQSSAAYSRLAFGYGFCLMIIFTYLGRLLSKLLLKKMYRKASNKKKLFVVTTYDKAETILKALLGDPVLLYEVSGLAVMDRDMIGEKILDWMVTAGSKTIYDDARLSTIDSVLIGLNPEHPEFKDTVNLFHVMGVEVNISSEAYEVHIPNQQIVKMGDLTVLSGNGIRYSIGDMMLKRMLDIVGGIIGILITAVLTIFVAPAIMIESPGPIFFSQTRVGKNGRRFKIYKFRSMYVDAEERKKELMEKNKMSGLMFKMDDDPRVTKIGKFIRKTSIDEFPQFYNVLKGDMSLVGTRPPTEDEFKRYKARYKKRLSMKPGITGLWQVSGRSKITNFEEVVKLDIDYIDHWSFGRDLRILLQTVLVVLKRDGAQ